MRVCTVRRIHRVEEFWKVTVGDWKNDIKAGQFLEQVRGPKDESIMLWEVLGEHEDTLILAPTRLSVANMVPTPTAAPPELKQGDHFDIFVGMRHSHMGLGDLIAKVTQAVGIEPCQGCEERKAKLNKLFPRVMRK